MVVIGELVAWIRDKMEIAIVTADEREGTVTG
jgi:hypothetical protein